ncbi:MAG: O-antigen ligase family protein [Cytophagales bacterium]|nr:O-antigen ligase family protein [Cytophagales bacterium]
MRKSLTLSLLHVLTGLLIANYRDTSFAFGILVLTVAAGHIVLSQNKNNQAMLWAAYLVGLEILLRMTGGFLVYEAGKYSVVFLLLLGLIVEQVNKPKPWPIVLYGILLLPSFAVVNFPDFLHFRKDVSFNLSGPLTLIVSTYYFYSRPLLFNQIVESLRFMVYPLISVIIYLTLVTPELSDIEYGTQSNFQAAAGFGPNQISIIMGLGILLVGLCLYYGYTLTGTLVTDVVIMSLFLIRGLATFSRGGMIGGIISLGLLILLSVLFAKRIISWPKALLYILGGLTIVLYSWNYVNEISDNRLMYRYQGLNYRTGQAKDITSGRLIILSHELTLFTDNIWLGVGPGMVREIAVKGVHFANTHSEFSRTLAEHGLFGGAALIIMIFFPVMYILKKPKEILPISFAILFLVFFTMFHSAMRLAMPGFLYGLVFFYPGKAFGSDLQKSEAIA